MHLGLAGIWEFVSEGGCGDKGDPSDTLGALKGGHTQPFVSFASKD